MQKINLYFLQIFLLVFSLNVFANDSENSVPLTLSKQPSFLNITETSIELNGKKVLITSKIDNEDNQPIRYGFFAYTPFFNLLGEGDTYQDKTFSDIEVKLNGKTIKTISNHRGFFLGNDITNILTKAGAPAIITSDFMRKALPILPKYYGFKLEDWSSYVSYSWILPLKSESKNVMSVSYQALPEFGQLPIAPEYGEEKLNNLIMQHCAQPSEVGKYLKSKDKTLDYVIYERYVLPIKYINAQSTNIKIIQPEKNWLGGHPVLSLVCGLDNQSSILSPNISGVIERAEESISILVISEMPK